MSYISNGKDGEAVTLTVEKGPDYHQQRTYAIPRAVIHNYTVDSKMFNEKVGYVKISSFNKATPAEFKTAIESLTAKGAESFIFDLRNNGGGDLEGIKGVLDYLLPEGPIIRIISKNGSEQVLTSDASSVDKPMAVIINGSTASAAELFSAALRDYGKAKLVGTTSYGKGTMQTVVSLPDGSGITISYRMYNPPYSDNYEGIGVQPDIVLPLADELLEKNFYKITDEEDNQIQTAVAILRGEMTVEEANAAN